MSDESDLTGLEDIESLLRTTAETVRAPDAVRERVLVRILGSQRARTPWRRHGGVLIFGVIAVAGLAGAAWWGVPVVKAKALLRAAQANRPAHLRSLYMESRELLRTSSGKPCTLTVRVWWQSPSSWRREVSGPCGNNSITVGNGHATTQVDAVTGRVLHVRGKKKSPLPAAPIAQVLQDAWPTHTARVVSSTVIGGHTTDEIVLRPTFKRQFSGQWPTVYEGITKVWIDPRTGLVLKWEVFTASGSVWWSSIPTSIQYNGQIRQGLFRVPVSARPERAQQSPKARAQGSKGTSLSGSRWALLTWGSARRRSSFPIVAPSTVPANMYLVLRGPSSGTIDGVVIDGYDRSGYEVLNITEKRSTLVAIHTLPSAMRRGPIMTVGGKQVHEFAGAHFWWEQDGVWISVGSDPYVPGGPLSVAQVEEIVATLSPTAVPILQTKAPSPHPLWTVWIPGNGPLGLPVNRGLPSVGRTGAQYQDVWQWQREPYAKNVLLREVPAPGVADGPITGQTRIQGLGIWPSGQESLEKVGNGLASLVTIRPKGMPQALSTSILGFVRHGTAIELTAHGIANAPAVLVAVAKSMMPATAIGGEWAQAG